MRYLTVEEVLALHSRIIASSGGSLGLREPNALDSAVAQPQMTFGGVDLYTTVARKAAALAATRRQRRAAAPRRAGPLNGGTDE